MLKINHAERLKKETGRDDGLDGMGDGVAYFDTLIDRAAGRMEVEAALDNAADRIVALGEKPDRDDAFNIIVDALHDALIANGFNAGFEAGLAEGVLLGKYGNKAG